MIAFALIGEESLIDLIPLAEVESCKLYEANDHLGENLTSTGSGFYALQIETSLDGYNSGALFVSDETHFLGNIFWFCVKVVPTISEQIARSNSMPSSSRSTSFARPLRRGPMPHRVSNVVRK
jgi:hypothetical protein